MNLTCALIHQSVLHVLILSGIVASVLSSLPPIETLKAPSSPSKLATATTLGAKQGSIPRHLRHVSESQTAINMVHRQEMLMKSYSAQQSVLCTLANAMPWILKNESQPWDCSSKISDAMICSTWIGISCLLNGSTTVTGIFLDMQGNGGYLPSIISNLTSLLSLQELTITSSGLIGTLPSILGNLTNLRSLDLFGKMNGTIPSALGRLINLKSLHLSGSGITGTIPSSIGLLKSLEHLSIHDMNLDGSIPHSISALSALLSINLSNNKLSRGLPSTLGYLTSIDIRDNQLTGAIPFSISRLTSLTSLALNGNRLNGNVSVLCSMSLLSTLSVSRNDFNGSIPSCIGNLTNLRILNMKSNSISGEIPRSIGHLTSLLSLELGYNFLSGTIPDTFSDLQSIHTLNLGKNALRGSVPFSIGLLTTLVNLNLGANLLTGTIPRTFKYLKRLEVLEVGGNSLVGPTPVYLADCHSLTFLNLSHNRLQGVIPRIMGNSDSLKLSSLSGNELKVTSRAPEYTLHMRRRLPLSEHRIQNLMLMNASDVLFTSSTDSHTGTGASDPDINSVTATAIAVSVACSFLFLIACGSLFLLFYSRRRKYARAVLLSERSSKLNTLPVHRAILEREDPETILRLITNHVTSLMVKDTDGNTAFDFALEYECDMRVITMLLLNSLPVDKATRGGISPLVHGYAWCKAVQLDRFADAISRILSEHSMLAYELSMVKDLERRTAVDIACPKIKKLIMMNLYLLKRYDVTTWQNPHHRSETCIVHLAIDREDNDRRVALKFMKDRNQFLREVRSRNKGEYDGEFVVGILRLYDGAENESFAEEMQRKNLSTYQHCIVMEAGDRSLYDILTKENIAGKNMEYVKIIVAELAKAVQHVHSKGFIHGDLKPLNIMRVEQKMKLIDFDASVSYVDYQESSCSKYSSGYLPPELIHCDGFKVCVKSCAGFDNMASNSHSSSYPSSYPSSGRPSLTTEDSSKYRLPFTFPFSHPSSSMERQFKSPFSLYTSESFLRCDSRRASYSQSDDEETDLEPGHITYEGEQDGFFGFQPMPPSPSQDVWALGLVIFQLTANQSLFNCDGEGNIDDIQLRVLAEWSDATKTQQLLRVKNSYARNLISLMLVKDPKKRLSIAQVLAHSFITGKKATRLAGDVAKYDVFISYRVASDLPYARMLYEWLTARGIRVWWDAKCLRAGEQWEDGFCSGLVNSCIFIPLISRGAVNHPTASRQNFEELTSDSPCDNVFLEHRLALELKERGLIEKIFPLFIGDQIADQDGRINENSEYSKYTFAGTNQCHPDCPPVVVDTVEAKVRKDLDKLGQGMPYFESLTLREVMTEITCYQGAFVEGDLTASIAAAVELVLEMMSREVSPRQRKQRSVPSPRLDFIPFKHGHSNHHRSHVSMPEAKENN